VSAQPDVPVLRPLGVGEVLDVGIKLTVRHWWTLVRAVLVVVVPLQFVAALALLSAPSESDLSTFGENGTLSEHDVWTFGAAVFVGFVLSLLGQMIATGACFKAVADGYLGRQPSWRDSLVTVLRRLHSILWISALVGILAFLALIACIVPGVWLYVAWVVAVPAFLTEGVRGRAALGRSFRLVRGFWWRTFAIVVLGLLLAGVLRAAIGGVLEVVTLSSDNELVNAIAGFVSSVLSGAITTPFVAAVTIVLYIDLRVRKEGFDLALLAARFGGGEPGAEAVPIPAPPPAAPRPRPEYGGSQPPFWPPPPGWTPDREEP